MFFKTISMPSFQTANLSGRQPFTARMQSSNPCFKACGRKEASLIDAVQASHRLSTSFGRGRGVLNADAVVQHCDAADLFDQWHLAKKVRYAQSSN